MTERFSDREQVRQWAELFAWPYLGPDELSQVTPDFDRIGLARAQQRRAVVLTKGHDERMHRAVIADPHDSDLIRWLECQAGVPLQMCLATADDIHACLNRHEANARAMDGVLSHESVDLTSVAGLQELSLAALSDATSPVVRLVNSTLYDAFKAGASDIHLEATEAGLIVRFRVDGVLDTEAEFSGQHLAEQVISRLKVLADLDIAERRVPQDGSFRVRAQGRDVDMRVSVMPSVHGEDAVIRVLDKQAMLQQHGRLTLESLGFDQATLLEMRELLDAPHGLFLVTGPTGSGKTTTLYAALSECINGREKIITIEDPVEYQLQGVLQIPVNEKKGLTFARGLRSILRHDPDRIMVGEIRDKETAEIAIQSALTGHVVLSSVHANSVFDVFGRFAHMGLDPYSLVSALNGVWAQRLLRINCTTCSRPFQPAARELERFRGHETQWAGYRFHKGVGCGDCRGQGYKGRRAIAEFLRLDDTIREMLLHKVPLSQVRQVAQDQGTRSLTTLGLELVREGLTTLEEVKRVTLAV